MEIIAGSLQYSPVFKSLVCAFGRQCSAKGHSVKYLFSKRYEWMLPESVKRGAYFFGQSHSVASSIADGFNPAIRRDLGALIRREKPEAMYLHNIQPLLNIVAGENAKRCSCRFIQHVHEPFVKDKSSYELKHRVVLNGFEFLQGVLLKHVDVAVVSSKEARLAFRTRYGEFGGKLLEIPLLYEDLGMDLGTNHERTYFTFIGPLLASKGPETFFRIVRQAEENGLDFEFLLVTKEAPKEFGVRRHSRLRVYTRLRISDQELGECLKRSVAVLAPYRTARQSSVVSVASMYGTPVIATNVGGLAEVVKHGEDGYLVDLDSGVEEWIKGMEHVRSNLRDMSRKSREAFVKRHSEVNWSTYIDSLLEG